MTFVLSVIGGLLIGKSLAANLSPRIYLWWLRLTGQIDPGVPPDAIVVLRHKSAGMHSYYVARGLFLAGPFLASKLWWRLDDSADPVAAIAQMVHAHKILDYRIAFYSDRRPRWISLSEVKQAYEWPAGIPIHSWHLVAELIFPALVLLIIRLLAEYWSAWAGLAILALIARRVLMMYLHQRGSRLAREKAE